MREFHSLVAFASSWRIFVPSAQRGLERVKSRAVHELELLAPALGITRVTDITRLDRIGIPVYSSVRPSAIPGSLCVNAGKGILPVEAEVGAFMEAIEFAFAEPHHAHTSVTAATPRDVLDGRIRPDAVLDFCPPIGHEIELRKKIDCVTAIDALSGNKTLVPAECVLHPYRARRRSTLYFGSNTNGLCSGNTELEAMVHGLAEVVERDIRSFHLRVDASKQCRGNNGCGKRADDRRK